MTTKKRKQYRPEEKVPILRRHLVDGMAISDVCDEYGMNPTVFYRWQKEFFEHGSAAFVGCWTLKMGEDNPTVTSAY